MASLTTDTRPTADDALPSLETRTVVSLLLFMHLSCLAIGLLANEPSSRLERDLGRLIQRLYLQPLAMDLSYGFYLTHADELDVDFTMEADLKRPDGTTVKATFPTTEISPGIRYRRYGMLAWHVARQAQEAEESGDESSAGVLPRAIAASLVAETGAIGGTIRCRGHRLLERQDVESSDPVRSDPFKEDAYFVKYPATVLISDGQVQLLKESSRAESAPAVAPSSATPPGATGSAGVAPSAPASQTPPP